MTRPTAMRPSPNARLFVLLICMVAFSLRARAQIRPASEEVEAQLKERAAKARVLCSAGKPDEGVTELAKLFVETGDEAYVYNQGRCYEENGIYDKAILRFEEYLRKAHEVLEEDRRSTERRIEELRHRLKESQAANPTPAPGPTAQPPPPAYAPPPTVESASPRQAWPWQRTAGLAGMVGGGLSLLVGVLSHVRRESNAEKFIDAGCGTAMLDAVPGCRERFNRIESSERMMGVGYGGAVLLGGVGAYLFFTAPEVTSPDVALTNGARWRKGASARGLSVGCGPDADSGRLGFFCSGSF